MNQDNNSNNRSGNGIPDIFNMPLGGNNDNTKLSGGIPQMNSGMVSQSNPVPPVRPVAPQTAGNPGMIGQSTEQPNPQSAIAEPEVVNEWVAAVEAQKEPTVMQPTVQAPPSVPKTVAPQTVEDLITPSMPIAPINNKLDRKTGNKKILFMIAAIVVGVLILFGVAYVWLNGRNKTLTCILKDTDNGITYTTIGEFKFKGKKVTSVMAGLEYVVVDDTDHSSELQVVGAAFQFLDENIKKRSGTTTKLDTNDRQAKYYITVDLNKMKDSDWYNDTDSMMNVDVLKEKEKDYKTIKEELTDQGYTCK